MWSRIQKTQIEGGLAELERLLNGNTAAGLKMVATWLSRFTYLCFPGAAARDVLKTVEKTLDDEAASDAAARQQVSSILPAEHRMTFVAIMVDAVWLSLDGHAVRRCVC